MGPSPVDPTRTDPAVRRPRDDAGAFVGGVGTFLSGGLREGDHVVAVATPEKLGWLRDELGGDASAIDLLEAPANREPADVRAYMRYEAASNVLYRQYDVSVLCP